MYFGDHNPPHFHAVYQEHQAEYDIATLNVIVGSLPKRAHALVLEWASLHISELMANWEKTQVPDTLDKINPLN